MKNLTILTIIVFVALAAFFMIRHNSPVKSDRILQANLTAALNLENSFIPTCGDPTFDFTDPKSKAPLFEGLGSHTFPISTKNKMAQKYFDQGLKLAYAFNHTEAHRSFKEASKLSESTAFTYWGQAYAIGPNINDPFIDDQRKQMAVENLTKAKELSDNASPLEKSLIDALMARYDLDGDSITVNSTAYMEKMKTVAEKFPDNADVQTLYAAAIMNTMPWNYWNKDNTPKENTPAIMEALKSALSIDKDHAGAYHYHIHLTELPFPDEAANSGDQLASLMPGAGHIVHMPSHAYIRVGRYKDAAEANLKAIKADEKYISQCYSQGIYPLGYYPHNIHFLWSAATHMGDRETALAAARKTAEKSSRELQEAIPVLQEFAAIPIQAYVRFGQWDEILTIPNPGNNLKHLKVFWLYGRGLGFIAKDNTGEAAEELSFLKEMVMDSSLNEIILYSYNTTHQVAQIAHDVLAAELASANGDITSAKRYFQSAIEHEDNLNYTEPPAWHLSTRLNYGDFLVEQKEYEEAEVIFRQDLEVWRSNGWALRGLYNALQGQGKKSEADEIMKKFENSWQYSDIDIESAVL